MMHISKIFNEKNNNKNNYILSLSQYFIVAILSWLPYVFPARFLSTLSVPALYLKDSLIENYSIHSELLLTVGVVHWSKLPRWRQHKGKKNFSFTINSYLLKRFGVKIIYSIYQSREIVTLLFRYEDIWCYVACIEFYCRHRSTRDRERTWKAIWTGTRTTLCHCFKGVWNWLDSIDNRLPRD